MRNIFKAALVVVAIQATTYAFLVQGGDHFLLYTGLGLFAAWGLFQMSDADRRE